MTVAKAKPVQAFKHPHHHAHIKQVHHSHTNIPHAYLVCCLDCAMHNLCEFVCQGPQPLGVGLLQQRSLRGQEQRQGCVRRAHGRGLSLSASVTTLPLLLHSAYPRLSAPVLTIACDLALAETAGTVQYLCTHEWEVAEGAFGAWPTRATTKCVMQAQDAPTHELVAPLAPERGYSQRSLDNSCSQAPASQASRVASLSAGAALWCKLSSIKDTRQDGTAPPNQSIAG